MLPALEESHESSTVASLKVQGFPLSRAERERMHKERTHRPLACAPKAGPAGTAARSAQRSVLQLRLSAEFGYFSSLECWFWVILGIMLETPLEFYQNKITHPVTICLNSKGGKILDMISYGIK